MVFDHGTHYLWSSYRTRVKGAVSWEMLAEFFAMYTCHYALKVSWCNYAFMDQLSSRDRKSRDGSAALQDCPAIAVDCGLAEGSKDNVMHLIPTWPLISVFFCLHVSQMPVSPPPWCGRKAPGLRGRRSEFQIITEQCWDLGKSVNFSCLAFLICTKEME